MQDATTFAFEGRYGHLSVIKEARPRGTGYWYAYSRQARHTRKRYLGRAATLAHLEQVAKALMGKHGPITLQHPTSEASSRHEQPLPPASGPGLVSLLTTKLVPPQLPASLVERERLLKDLDAASSHQLVLVSAAAGSGKTTLLSAWASRKRASQIVAWLSLDALDNDLARFWVSVITALRASLAEPRRAAPLEGAHGGREGYSSPARAPSRGAALRDLEMWESRPWLCSNHHRSSPHSQRC